MEIPISGLRQIGFLVGLALILIGVLYFRGRRWDKASFLLTTTIGAGAIAVSLFPNSANWLAEAFDIERDDRGRIIGLLIAASAFLLFLQLGHAARVSQLQLTLDRTIRAVSLQSLSYKSKNLLKFYLNAMR